MSFARTCRSKGREVSSTVIDFGEQLYRQHFKRKYKEGAFRLPSRGCAATFSRLQRPAACADWAGKTWAVLAPFLFDGWKARPTRLIYALPLRTLAQGVYHQARDAAKKFGHPIEPTFDKNGHEKIHPYVTLQTGEQPDDEFLIVAALL